MGDAVDKALSPIFSIIVVPLLELLFAVATVVFVYGVIQVVLNQVDTEAHEKGRKSMLYGIIGLFIMLSAWGIIYFVGNPLAGFGK